MTFHSVYGNHTTSLNGVYNPEIILLNYVQQILYKIKEIYEWKAGS